MSGRQYLSFLLLVLTAVFIWSAIRPHDYFTWFLEVFPVLIALPLLAMSYRNFPLTNLVYGLIAAHMVILLVGGHYTYAEMPLFSWCVIIMAGIVIITTVWVMSRKGLFRQ
jgi:putative membrane protein